MPEAKMKHVWMVEDAPAPPGATSKEPRSYWTKIGVAYENADGSWSLQLAAVPVTGRMQLRDPALAPGTRMPERAGGGR